MKGKKRKQPKKSRLHSSLEAAFLKGGQCVLQGASKEYPVELRGIPQCTRECPAGVNVKAYVHLIANGKFEEAIDVIRNANPFPAVCGRVCTRPCETHCELGAQGDAISIRDLKRYAADYELARRPLVMKPCILRFKEKIAIVGSGPAGLTAAVDLIRLGYPVTVFEEKKEPGGMLRYGIPSYRLPKRILNKDIEWILGLGVQIQTNKKIIDPTYLLSQGFDAVLIAGGAPKSFTLGISGENASGVVDALWFLREINMNHTLTVKGTVVVIGGGSTAFDVARSAIRLGAKKVIIAYRRGIKEMPADEEEIRHAKEEGVQLLPLAIPKRIIVKNKTVAGIEFLKAKLGKKDASGRRQPMPIPRSEFIEYADMVVPAVGAMPDIGPMQGVKVITPKGIIDVSTYGHTSVDGVFAAGDVEMGPSSVVEAIGRGHQAAQGIHAHVRGIQPQEVFDSMESSMPVVLEPEISSHSTVCSDALMVKGKVSTFAEVKRTFSDFEAIEEASRCFTCGPCTTCPICLPNCANKQVVAETKTTSFLLKVPASLSLEITEHGASAFHVQCAKQVTPIVLHSLTSVVDSSTCLGCGRCEEVCAYRAIRNIITKDKRTTSKVFHDACSSCSACVSSCPSGAISQGYMSDAMILSRLEQTQSPYEGVKAFMSFWSTSSAVLGGYPGVMEIMSARKITPMFLLRALARAGRGILVIGPEKTESHYLPWEEQPEEMIQRTQTLLKLVGISPERVHYKEVPKETQPQKLLKEFSQRLENKNLTTLTLPIPENIQSPVGKAMTLLRIMSAYPDQAPSDEFLTSSPKKTGETVVFEGCLPLLQWMGETHKLYDLRPTRQALRTLLDTMDISYSFLPGFACPSKGLLDFQSQKFEEIVEKIAENNYQILQQRKPQKILIATPEAYQTFSQEKTMKTMDSLPHELITKIEKKTVPLSHPLTIALHPACALDNDPFYEEIKTFLQKIPQITLVELTTPCHHTGFQHLTGDTKLSALYLMEEAVHHHADMILCTSPYCQAHLLLSQRTGSWRPVEIEITDVYSVLLSLLQGENQ